jgi:hypothetical protein
MLYHKSLYVLTLHVARSQRVDESNVVDIRRQYAKGDYDGAMGQFVSCIGWTEASK